jgi:hypothetical protein
MLGPSSSAMFFETTIFSARLSGIFQLNQKTTTCVVVFCIAKDYLNPLASSSIFALVSGPTIPSSLRP